MAVNITAEATTFQAAGQTFTITPAVTPYRETVQKVTNTEGQIALKYRQPQARTEMGKYAFAIRANISLSWVDPSDADILLRKMGGCCGGRQRAYHYANESDVKRWTNGGGR